ncbi:MAG TPA: hypothetical protein VMC79_13355 [Rectinemataceae bacterium]|nr:hypothetical protein [Rectinemataceae bacterium]
MKLLRDQALTVAAAALLVGVLALAGCSLGGSPAGQSVANAAASEVVYGSEVEEPTSSSSPLCLTGNNLGTHTDTETVVVSGSAGGTVSVAHDMTWVDTGLGPDSLFNRTWHYYGSRTLTYAGYSNNGIRTVNGTVNVVLNSLGDPAVLVNTCSSVAAGQPVVSTASNVKKTVTGDLTVSYNGTSYEVSVDLLVTVTSRVVDWTISGSPGSYYLTGRTLVSRDVTTSGTVSVNGTVHTVNRTMTVATYQ